MHILTSWLKAHDVDLFTHWRAVTLNNWVVRHRPPAIDYSISNTLIHHYHIPCTYAIPDHPYGDPRALTLPTIPNLTRH